MQISFKEIGFLGNPKFCTADEALKYAENCWLSRNDELGYGCSEHSYKRKVRETVLMRPDISPEKALKCAEKCKDDHILELVIEKVVPWEMALECAKRLGNHFGVWRSTLCKTDFPIQQALPYAKEFEKYQLPWSHIGPDVVKRDDLKKLPPEELLSLAEEFDFWPLWFMASNNLSVQEYVKSEIEPEKAFSYLEKMESLEMVVVVLSRTDVDQDKAINYAKKWHRDEVWMALLMRPDIAPEKAIFWAKEKTGSEILDAVLKRPDVQRYLNS
ncbi:MAG: hypothetical protein WDK96_03055 [Candidatus Paceibacterota bacterium]|jgi:hypothetical protein